MLYARWEFVRAGENYLEYQLETNAKSGSVVRWQVFWRERAHRLRIGRLGRKCSLGALVSWVWGQDLPAYFGNGAVALHSGYGACGVCGRFARWQMMRSTGPYPLCHDHAAEELGTCGAALLEWACKYSPLLEPYGRDDGDSRGS